MGFGGHTSEYGMLLRCVLCLLIVVEGLFGLGADEVKSVSVMEGHSVTLHTDVTHVEREDQILWQFGPREARIAEIYKQKPKTETGIFGDRLKLNNETGSLTITNASITDSGFYKLEIINGIGTLYKRFNVTVNERLSVPITKQTQHRNITDVDATAGNRLYVCTIVAATVWVLVVFLLLSAAVKHWISRQSGQRSHEEEGTPMTLNNDMRANSDADTGPQAASNGVH